MVLGRPGATRVSFSVRSQRTSIASGCAGGTAAFPVYRAVSGEQAFAGMPGSMGSSIARRVNTSPIRKAGGCKSATSTGTRPRRGAGLPSPRWKGTMFPQRKRCRPLRWDASRITGVTASPFETRAPMPPALARTEGGEGLARSSNNHGVRMGEEAPRLAGRSPCKGMGIDVPFPTYGQISGPERFASASGYVTHGAGLREAPKAEAMDEAASGARRRLPIDRATLGSSEPGRRHPVVRGCRLTASRRPPGPWCRAPLRTCSRRTRP